MTVTLSPVAVNSPKPELDRLLTFPIDPPAAGPDRALDPPAPGPRCPDVAAVARAVIVVPEPVLAMALTMP
ncbi:MAG TPA: hypothetical protein VKG38_01545 [Solirubrobacteraceae bacterium]|nr:hypothetical protein [Solirubrobacteraceae bacterium]